MADTSDIRLSLTPDELLSTTRAVRKRLDLERPVPDALIRECVAAAMQAPSGSNLMTMQFVVVRDPAKRKAIGDVYRRCYDVYRQMDGVYAGSVKKEGEAEQRQQARVATSADHLAEHLAEVPVHVLACTYGRVNDQPATAVASRTGNVLPAMWSFMLAARARGLGTAWTTIHLMQEQLVAEIVGIPFGKVQQLCLSPLAYTIGTDFKPAGRPDPDTIIHWDRW